MSTIKPPGGPGSTGGIQGPHGSDATGSTTGTRGASFQDQIAPTSAAGAAPAPAGPQAVVADLRAGRITPDQAVARLTDLAVQRSGAPPAARPAVEARMRDLLARDPLVQDLLRQMGATITADDS